MALTSRAVGLASAAVNAAGRLVDAAVRGLTAAWARAWARLAAAFTVAVEALIAAAEGRWPPRRAVSRDPALQRALDAATREASDLADLAAAEATAAARAAAAAGLDAQTRIINAQMPDGVSVPQPQASLRARALAAITRRVQQRITVLTRPLSREAVRVMRQELVRGVDLGTGPASAAARMVRRVEGAFDGGLARAATIARTETLDAYRRAAAAGQELHQEHLDGWVWLAALNTDTCPACWAMHGTEHPLSEPGPLGHPNCRCTRVAKTKPWADLGLPELDEDDDLIPDAQAVFREMPRAIQLQIMGPTRLELLDDGDIDWRDLARRRDNPDWRPSYVPTPVRQLARSA